MEFTHPGPTIDIVVKTLMGTEFVVEEVDPRDLVILLKLTIQDLSGLKASHQHLIYGHQELDDDDRSLQSYGIVEDRCVLKLVTKMRGGPLNARRAASATSIEPETELVLELLDGSDVVGAITLDEELFDLIPGTDGKQFLVYIPTDDFPGELERMTYMDVEDMYGHIATDGAAPESSLFGDAVDSDNPSCHSPMCSSRGGRPRSYSGIQLCRDQEEREAMEFKVERLRARMDAARSTLKQPVTRSNAPTTAVATATTADRRTQPSAAANEEITQPSDSLSPLPLHLPPSVSGRASCEEPFRAQGPTPLRARGNESAELLDEDEPMEPPSVPRRKKTATRERLELGMPHHNVQALSPLPAKSVPSSKAKSKKSAKYQTEPADASTPSSVVNRFTSVQPLDHRDILRRQQSQAPLAKPQTQPAPIRSRRNSNASLNPVRPAPSLVDHPTYAPTRESMATLAKQYLGGGGGRSLDDDVAHAMTVTHVMQQARPHAAASGGMANLSRNDSRTGADLYMERQMGAQSTWYPPRSARRRVEEDMAVLQKANTADRLQRAGGGGGGARAEARNGPVAAAKKLESKLTLPMLQNSRVSKVTTTSSSSLARLPMIEPVQVQAGGGGKAAKESRRQRCSQCNRKLPLAGSFPCRCGLLLCTAHRYPEEHSCSYDYKTEGRRELQEANPTVRAIKLPKI